MTQPLPPGQGPVDPQGAFSMPPAPGMPMPGMPMPPMPGMPPMPMPPFAPPPPRRGRRWVLILLLLLALVGSVVVNLVLFGVIVVGAAAEVRQTVISGEGSDKVAVVGIDQLIDDESAQAFETVIKEVEKDSAVKALVVEIDTPGGSATSSDEMYHRLDRFKNSKRIPVVIAMRGMATSGGYYVSVAGDYLFAEPGCLTGNIGVLFPRFNVSQMIGKWGVSETTLTATTPGHSYKNAGSMFQPPNPEDEKYLQGLVDGVFAQFKAVVQAGRKGKLADTQGDVFSGKAFTADDALARGLIDKIGYPDEAYDYAAHLAGLTGRSIVRYAPNPNLLQLLTARSNLGAAQTKASPKAVTIDGVSVDTRTAEDLLCARPLLLWRGN
jgi:protease-4